MGPSAAFDNVVFRMSDTIFHNLSQSPFAGPPSPDIDAAWDKLLAPMHMRISIQELRRDNQNSVQLPEGGGYLGWMGVFHELHCIVRRIYIDKSFQEILSRFVQTNRRRGCCESGTTALITIPMFQSTSKNI